METESLESKMLVATQSIETMTTKIIRLREFELFPQLLELVVGGFSAHILQYCSGSQATQLLLTSPPPCTPAPPKQKRPFNELEDEDVGDLTVTARTTRRKLALHDSPDHE